MLKSTEVLSTARHRVDNLLQAVESVEFAPRIAWSKTLDQVALVSLRMKQAASQMRMDVMTRVCPVPQAFHTDNAGLLPEWLGTNCPDVMVESQNLLQEWQKHRVFSEDSVKNEMNMHDELLKSCTKAISETKSRAIPPQVDVSLETEQNSVNKAFMQAIK